MFVLGQSWCNPWWLTGLKTLPNWLVCSWKRYAHWSVRHSFERYGAANDKVNNVMKNNIVSSVGVQKVRGKYSKLSSKKYICALLQAHWRTLHRKWFLMSNFTFWASDCSFAVFKMIKAQTWDMMTCRSKGGIPCSALCLRSVAKQNLAFFPRYLQNSMSEFRVIIYFFLLLVWRLCPLQY